MERYILVVLFAAIVSSAAVSAFAANYSDTNSTSDINSNLSAINSTAVDNGTSDDRNVREPRSPTEEDDMPSYLTATGENQTQKEITLAETGLPIVGIVFACIAAIGLICKRK